MQKINKCWNLHLYILITIITYELIVSVIFQTKPFTFDGNRNSIRLRIISINRYIIILVNMGCIKLDFNEIVICS